MSWRTVWQQWFGWLMRWIASSFAMSDPSGQVEPPSLPYVAPAPVVPSPARLPVPAEPIPFVAGPHVCEVCGVTLSLFTARTFDGHWRCPPHKAVTCDTCGRDLAPSTLRDAPWVCARHAG